MRVATRGDLGQDLLGERLVAALAHRRRRDHAGRDERAGRGGAAELLGDQHRVEEREAVAAVRLGHERSEHAELGELRVELARRARRACRRSRARARSDTPRRADAGRCPAGASVHPTVRSPRSGRLVQIHAAYGYRQYRDGSLWALLDAVLRHPRADWVQAWLPELGGAVLAPIRGEFLEALELATLGCRARLSDGATAAAELDTRIRAARHAAAELRTGNSGGQGDTWGAHKRRLAALAEVLVRTTRREDEAAELVAQALDIHYGFTRLYRASRAPSCRGGVNREAERRRSCRTRPRGRVELGAQRQRSRLLFAHDGTCEGLARELVAGAVRCARPARGCGAAGVGCVDERICGPARGWGTLRPARSSAHRPVAG